jgi:hypothetical protein
MREGVDCCQEEAGGLFLWCTSTVRELNLCRHQLDLGGSGHPLSTFLVIVFICLPIL